MRKYLVITIMFLALQGTSGRQREMAPEAEGATAVIVLQVVDDEGTVLASKCIEP